MWFLFRHHLLCVLLKKPHLKVRVFFPTLYDRHILTLKLFFFFFDKNIVKGDLQTTGDLNEAVQGLKHKDNASVS